MRKRKFNSRYKSELVSEINVTPFVDILLVLLIVFMVVMPILSGNMEVELPDGHSSPDKNTNSISVLLKDGKIYVGNNNMLSKNLEQDLLKVSQNNFNIPVFITADKKENYGEVMYLVKIINKFGFKYTSLVHQINN